MTDFTGRTLGRYTLLEQIGKGGMATVYKALQPSTNRNVAIKVLPPQFTHDDTFIQRFRQEARVIAQLEHPSILPIYDFGEEDDIAYIVMRYVDGGTLNDRIEDHSLTLAEMRRILRQVGSALDYAHEHGVIHRDLKPRNILMDGQGNAYLSDFGIAKLIETTMELTGSGVMGTPAYISPEVAQGAKADRRADVYALGVVTFEMLTGQPPYQAENPMAMILKHVNEPVPSTRTFAPDVPLAVDGVVQQALAKDPAERFRSTGVFARAFSDAVMRREEIDSNKAEAVVEGGGRPLLVRPNPTLRRLLPASQTQRRKKKVCWAADGGCCPSWVAPVPRSLPACACW